MSHPSAGKPCRCGGVVRETTSKPEPESEPAVFGWEAPPRHPVVLVACDTCGVIVSRRVVRPPAEDAPRRRRWDELEDDLSCNYTFDTRTLADR